MHAGWLLDFCSHSEKTGRPIGIPGIQISGWVSRAGRSHSLRGRRHLTATGSDRLSTRRPFPSLGTGGAKVRRPLSGSMFHLDIARRSGPRGDANSAPCFSPLRRTPVHAEGRGATASLSFLDPGRRWISRPGARFEPSHVGQTCLCPSDDAGRRQTKSPRVTHSRPWSSPGAIPPSFRRRTRALHAASHHTHRSGYAPGLLDRERRTLFRRHAPPPRIGAESPPARARALAAMPPVAPLSNRTPSLGSSLFGSGLAARLHCGTPCRFGSNRCLSAERPARGRTSVPMRE